MNNTFIESLGGWSAGYLYIFQKKKENEIKQGKNYYLTAPIQFAQINGLANIIHKINTTLPSHSLKTPISLMCNVLPLLSLPILFCCAAVKHGNYDAVAGVYNSSRYSYIKLPKTLNAQTTKIANFIAEHAGDMVRAAIVVGVIALAVLGQTAYAAGFSIALAYAALDHKRWIPARISLLAELYMPAISIFGSLFHGTKLAQVLSALILPSYLSSSLQHYVHIKVDGYVRNYFKVEGPTLKEIEAPVIDKAEMTYDEIQTILNNTMNDYEINPAHCSKPIIDLEKLPKDTDFDKFLPLYDSVDWKSKYALVFNKLKDDDRFIDFLFEKFPEMTKDNLKIKAEEYLEKLAIKKGISKEEFAADWAREQMVALIDLLMRRRPLNGLQEDFHEAYADCSKLLPFLLSNKNEMELEDALLEMAIEGGAYCPRGVKSMAQQLMGGLIQSGIPQEILNDPSKSYEFQILQTLQNYRASIMKNAYKTIFKKLPSALTQDVHGFDIYRLFFSLGFYPLTEHEKLRLSLGEVGNWIMMSSEITPLLYDSYLKSLDAAVSAVGELHFGIYICNMINENKLLSDAQKAELVEKLTERNNNQWTVEETQEKFHLLLFIKLGVLK